MFFGFSCHSKLRLENAVVILSFNPALYVLFLLGRLNWQIENRKKDPGGQAIEARHAWTAKPAEMHMKTSVKVLILWKYSWDAFFIISSAAFFGGMFPQRTLNLKRNINFRTRLKRIPLFRKYLKMHYWIQPGVEIRFQNILEPHYNCDFLTNTSAKKNLVAIGNVTSRPQDLGRFWRTKMRRWSWAGRFTPALRLTSLKRTLSKTWVGRSFGRIPKPCHWSASSKMKF